MKRYKSKRRMMTVLAFMLFSVAMLAIIVSLINAYMIIDTKDDILLSNDTNKHYDCIFVLGAGVRDDGTPSHMLEDRLLTALSLYEAGASDKIVLSGDKREGYDEPGAMYKYLTDAGVEAEALVCHYTGYSTSASIKWLAEEFRDGDVVIVTQKYHLYRALYMADELDVDAVGAASDPRTYSGQMFRDIREFAARVKDFFLIKLTK